LQTVFDKCFEKADKNKDRKLALGKVYDTFWDEFRKQMGLEVEHHGDLNML